MISQRREERSAQRRRWCAIRRRASALVRGFDGLSVRSAHSFSLVELVIVVVIIGVIAAIAIPRLAKGTSGAGEAALKKNLQALRTAIDTYAGEHGGVFPGALADGLGGAALSGDSLKSQLTNFSNPQGQCSATAGSGFRLGPYLQQIPAVPVGPNRGSAAVAIDSANVPPLVTGGPEGWVYNPLTGQIIANTDHPNDTGTLTWDSY